MPDTTDVATLNRLIDLARAGSEFTVDMFDTKGLGDGLPPMVPIGYDRRIAPNLPALVDIRPFAEKWRLHPERRKGFATATTLASFIDLTNRLKTEHSVIFGETGWPDPALTSIANYHDSDATNGKAGFCDHGVRYEFPVTDELSAWMEQNRVPMSQGAFASFIEDRIADIADPTDNEASGFRALFHMEFGTPADLLSLSRGLEVTVNSAVKQQHTLQTGEREIVFTEEHATKVTVPGLFMLQLAPFVGAEPVRIGTKLRYRAQGGNLMWSYDMYLVQQILRQHVAGDMEEAGQDTGLPTYQGSLSAEWEP